MKLRVQRVDGVLERLNLRRRNAQDRARLFVRLARKAEVGAEIEQIVLDSRQHGLDREIGRIARIAHRKQREADGAIRFIDVAHGCDARVALSAAASRRRARSRPCPRCAYR